jgi:hypothetical protein
MRHIDSAKILLAACLLGIAANAAHAEHGRDFSAFYTLGSPHLADATHVAVPIALQLHNHSGADVANATVEPGSLPGRGSPSKRAGSPSADASPAVTVADRAMVRVTISLTVTKQEYQRWQLGGRPLLALSTRDRLGHRVLHPIEASPSPGHGATR